MLEEDLAACRAILARGSKSFAFAGRALPSQMRDKAAAFYAFCRVSDDLVDAHVNPREALEQLEHRLELAFMGRPQADSVDRALAWLFESHGLPKAALDALLEGYAWDVEGRTYETISETLSYAARVASSVGVAMTVLMERRERDTLCRAADLGAAMQLTNIARDVGEDARSGRLYLPLAWLRQEHIDPARFLAEPRYSGGLAHVVRRVLGEADRLYERGIRGIAALPSDARVAIRAAAFVYRDIGRVIRARKCDSVTRRASTSGARKMVLLAEAIGVEASARVRRSSDADEPPLPETRFLVDAASGA